MSTQPSHAGKRPFLDYMAAKHVEMFAQSTGRSLSNASSYLITEGYKAAVEQMTTAARHYTPPAETDNRKSVAYYLDETLINEIKRLSLAERKSASAVAADLIRAGLQARAAATA
jgi:hypothetical protein